MARKSRSRTTSGKRAKKPKPAAKVAARRRSASSSSALSKAKTKAWPRRLKKSPLTRTELKEFRQMLLDKRRALVGDMDGMAAEALRTNRQEGTGNLSKIPTHDADVGTDNFEQEFTLGLLESERIMLGEIDEALERIAKRTYGICAGTGQPISKARLRARPWAKYCIEYARMMEKGLVSRGQERSEPGRGRYEEGDEDDTDSEGNRENDSTSED